MSIKVLIGYCINDIIFQLRNQSAYNAHLKASISWLYYDASPPQIYIVIVLCVLINFMVIWQILAD